METESPIPNSVPGTQKQLFSSFSANFSPLSGESQPNSGEGDWSLPKSQPNRTFSDIQK